MNQGITDASHQSTSALPQSPNSAAVLAEDHYRRCRTGIPLPRRKAVNAGSRMGELHTAVISTARITGAC